VKLRHKFKKRNDHLPEPWQSGNGYGTGKEDFTRCGNQFVGSIKSCENENI
jgi:hypothetical protein